ncbi:zinc finger protein 773-like [Myotis lucifugus]|uniref:zinc finger protein 773-like n=1 Tax=Myotis lucifugus TaxID=59463 RepID=UPI000CCC7669|nr:zinc finger protein 773-like [Myotis lucifugus]
MEAPVLRRRAEVGVTFEDIALYFSRKEWSLLDEGQRQLYVNVMLENFELISSLGKTLTITIDLDLALPFPRPHPPGCALSSHVDCGTACFSSYLGSCCPGEGWSVSAAPFYS